MTTKLNKQQLFSKLGELTKRIHEHFPNVDVEYHECHELWGAEHARLEQRGFPMPSPDIDAILLVRAGDADRENAAEMADNLVDELRERNEAVVQVRATSEVWCKESQPMGVETDVPGRPAEMLSFFRHRQDDGHGLTFFCISDNGNHKHTWDRLVPTGPLS